jgi:hypothetical protein
VSLISLLSILSRPKQLCIGLFLGAVETGVELFYLLVFSSEGVLHLLHFGDDELVPLLQLLHAVPQVLILRLLLPCLGLVLLGESLPHCR